MAQSEPHCLSTQWRGQGRDLHPYSKHMRSFTGGPDKHLEFYFSYPEATSDSNWSGQIQEDLILEI